MDWLSFLELDVSCGSSKSSMSGISSSGGSGENVGAMLGERGNNSCLLPEFDGGLGVGGISPSSRVLLVAPARLGGGSWLGALPSEKIAGL